MFQAILFLLLTIVAIAILRRQYSGRLVATPFAHLLYFIFVIYIGGFLLAPQYDMHFTTVIALTGFVTALAALLGYFLATSDIRRDNQIVRRFGDLRMLLLLEDKMLLAGVIFLVVITIPLALYFYSGLPPAVSTVFDLVRGRASLDSLIEVSNTRFELTKGAYFGGEYRGQGVVRNVLTANATLICCYAASLVALKRTAGSIAGIAGAVVFAWIVVGGVGDRAPILELLVVAVSAYSLCSPVRPRVIAILLAIFVGLLLVTSLYSTKSMDLLRLGFGEGLSDLFWKNLERIFVGNSINDARVIELVESGRWNLRYGAVHLRNVLTAIPGIAYGRPVAYELFAYFNPYSNGTTFFSGTYATAAFLDFGKGGATVLFFLCGVAVGVTERIIFLKRRVTGLQFLFVPLLSFSVAKIVLYGPTGFAVELLVLAVLYFVMRGFMAAAELSARGRRSDTFVLARTGP